MIEVRPAKQHWNYFLALERDMVTVARYVEFAEANFNAYSIELAALLFAASSEVDVLCRSVSKLVAPDEPHSNIHDYRSVFMAELPEVADTMVFVPRFGLSFVPWQNWREGPNPHWWGSYNKVKHHRHTHFGEATLKNALNSLGALLVVTYHYYRLTLPSLVQPPFHPTKTMNVLNPPAELLRLDDSYYTASPS